MQSQSCFPNSDPYLTNLLCAASIHHLHQTIETLPVGLIEVNQQGLMTTVDDWSEKLLGYNNGELIGQSVDTIFGDSAEPVSTAIRSHTLGYVGKQTITTRTGIKLNVEVAMAPCIENYLMRLHIIYAADE